MGGLNRIIGSFLALWLIFYISAYFIYMAPDDTQGQRAAGADAQRRAGVADTPFARSADPETAAKLQHRYFAGDLEMATGTSVNVPSVVTNPFVSETCAFLNKHAREMLKEQHADGIKYVDGVGVVIPARNENKALLLKTVESIMRNSGSELRQIVIIDDNSHEPIESWSEWNDQYDMAEKRFGAPGAAATATNSEGSVLRIVRSTHRRGVAGAKAYGASLLKDPVGVVAFVDAHVIVSHDWLIPLITALDKHPQSIVYPAIDVIDAATGDMIKGENAVGAFDWAFNFRWELLSPPSLIEAKRRMPLSATDAHGHPITENDLATSPAAPGIFAMKLRYYNYVGGMNPHLYPWGQDSVELSLRTWLCGGSVVRQPCSRVAHAYQHLYEPSILNGVMQAHVDKNVLAVAELWLNPAQRETVYQARFVGRVPYTVELSLDARQPAEFMHVSQLTQEACQSFDWYLTEVYPGLETDRPQVEIAYRNHLASDYFKTSMAPLLAQYEKTTTARVNTAEVATLQKRENKPEELILKENKQRAIPKDAEPPRPPTPDELHDNRVRDFNECIDRPATPVMDYCGVMATEENCSKNKIGLMFACPQTCGFCGSDGLTCFDYYLKKCPQWKAEGKCSSDEANMKNICRQSCGFCTVHKVQKVQKVQSKASAGKADNKPGDLSAESMFHVDTSNRHAEGGERAKVVVMEKAPAHNDPPQHNDPPALIVEVNHNLPPKGADAPSSDVNPFAAQEQYALGELPDPPSTPTTACSLNDRPHGKLLAYMKLHPAPDTADHPPRIFCGIYTMESNHKTNVQATKETWAKRCTGFVAFSTVTDATIPAFKIDHEGEEAYDNMWQKSRSIWKYIFTHFADQFDYFLMGGDDMFYVTENLQHYLMSEEIVKMRETQKGLFLGRRFYPTGQVDEKVFNSGGAGYILDRKALHILGESLDDPKCFPHQKGFWEDVNVAHCLRESGAIVPHDTRDAKQRERFHPFTPGQHLEYRTPKKNPDWYPKYNPWLKEGYDCCAPDSISFHYSPAETTRQVYTYLYHCQDKHKHDP